MLGATEAKVPQVSRIFYRDLSRGIAVIPTGKTSVLVGPFGSESVVCELKVRVRAYQNLPREFQSE